MGRRALSLWLKMWHELTTNILLWNIHITSLNLIDVYTAYDINYISWRRTLNVWKSCKEVPPLSVSGEELKFSRPSVLTEHTVRHFLQARCRWHPEKNMGTSNHSKSPGICKVRYLLRLTILAPFGYLRDSQHRHINHCIRKQGGER